MTAEPTTTLSIFSYHTDALSLVLEYLEHKEACSLLLTSFALLRDEGTKLWVDNRVKGFEAKIKSCNEEVRFLKWDYLAGPLPAGPAGAAGALPLALPLSLPWMLTHRLAALDTVMKERDGVFVKLEQVTKLRKTVAWVILYRMDEFYGTSYLKDAFPILM